MSSLDPHIFRAYDIRGLAGTQITEDACVRIGRAFGSVLREHYGTEHPSVAVGRDARTHGPGFEEAMITGLLASGCRVLSIGQTPSPLNYFTLCKRNLDGSVQITASHNPKEDNGIKLQTRGAESFSGDDLQMLYKKVIQEDWLSGEGSLEETDAVTPYLDCLSTLFKDAGNGLNVIADFGNGVAGPVYNEALLRSGAHVTGLFVKPDGTFPHHAADPSNRETLKDLQAKVKETGADIGLAFDGDGDRLGLVDETATIRTADEVLLLLARDHLKRHPGSPIIFTVSNSGALASEIKGWGGKPIMTTVGHSFVEHAMRKHGATLGGEQSGHFFCGEDYFGFDDALVAALRVLKILSRSQKTDNGQPSTLSSLIAEFPKVYQTSELRPHCPDEKKAAIIERITTHFKQTYPVNDLDGARIDFGDDAWAGIRKSNTSPKLSICMEARSPQKLREIEGIVTEHLTTYPEIAL